MILKNRLLIATLLLSIFLLSFQKAPISNVDKLLQVNKTRETTEAMVKEVLSMYKKRYPNVSMMSWGSVESSVDYQSYYKAVKQIYSSNYKDVEIQELIKLHQPKTMVQYTAKTKKVEQQLYNAGKEFGRKLSTVLNSKIK